MNTDRKRIVGIDDDTETLRFISMALVPHEVETFTDPAAALASIKMDKPDLVIMDLQISGPPDGWTLLNQLKKSPETKTIPVSILSARYNKMPDIVRGLKEGAEDYILKPVHPSVLAARVAAFFRRVEMLKGQRQTRALRPPKAEEQVPILLGPLAVDPGARTVLLAGKSVELTRMEFDLLYYLARRPNRTVPAKELMMKVWKISVELETHTLSSHIYSLRTKLQPIADRLETLPAQGYRLTLP